MYQCASLHNEIQSIPQHYSKSLWMNQVFQTGGELEKTNN